MPSSPGVGLAADSESMEPEETFPRDQRPLFARPIVLYTLVVILIAVDGMTKANAVANGDAVFNPKPISAFVFVIMGLIAFLLSKPANAFDGLGLALLLAGGLGNAIWAHGAGVPDFIPLSGPTNELTIPLSLLGYYPKRAAMANVADLLIMAGILVLIAGMPASLLRLHKRRAERLAAAQNAREHEFVATALKERQNPGAKIPTSTGL